jgi:hypothetical protein
MLPYFLHPNFVLSLSCFILFNFSFLFFNFSVRLFEEFLHIIYPIISRLSTLSSVSARRFLLFSFFLPPVITKRDFGRESTDRHNVPQIGRHLSPACDVSNMFSAAAAGMLNR